MTPVNPSSKGDPYPYGFRDVEVIHPDGKRSWEMVPLTLEENLHLSERDRIPQTPFHEMQVTYLAAVCRYRAASHPRSVALSRCRIDWDVPGQLPTCPDLAV